MAFLIKVINFILYSNLWISVCAAMMTLRTLYLLEQPLEQPVVYAFVFSSTLFIYAGHRVIGLSKSKAFADKGRYKVIAKYRPHILAYAVLGAVGAMLAACLLSWRTLGLMAFPGLLSLGYIIPAFSGKDKKRLRDFDFVKIFLVAGVWAWVTVALPVFESGKLLVPSDLWLLAEVLFFVFAITIPFDIRDLKVDDSNAVQTIPARYGTLFAKRLAVICLLLSFAFFYCGDYHGSNWGLLIGTSVAYLATGILLVFSSPERKDYYYTALLDGTMILLPLLTILPSLW